MKAILISLIVTLGGSFSSAAVDKMVSKRAVSETSEGQAVFLDVRENEEVSQGRIKGSLVFPTSRIPSSEWDKFLTSLNKEKKIFVYCRSGRRAEKVTAELIKKGFKAENAGGLDELKKEGADTI